MSTVDLLFTNHLDESFNISALTIPSSTPTVSVDATVTCTGISAAALRNVFYYQTDNDIATAGTDDVKYYVDTSAFGGIDASLNASTNGTISLADGGFIAGESIAESFLRHTANGLFGTHLGVDLFTNETTVRAGIEASTLSLAQSINTDLAAVGINGTDSDLAGTSGGFYLDDSITDTKNVTRELINQLITDSVSVSRFEDISTNYSYSSKGAGYYHVPLVAGDTLSYAVTIFPDPSQNDLVATGGTATSRKFRVKLVLSA